MKLLVVVGLALAVGFSSAAPTGEDEDFDVASFVTRLSSLETLMQLLIKALGENANSVNPNGQDSYRPDSYDDFVPPGSGLEKNPYANGENAFGQNAYGPNRPKSNDVIGGEKNPYENGENGFGQNAYGENPYGQNAYGENPYGQNPYGQDPYSQNPYGQDPYSQNANVGSPYANGENAFNEYAYGENANVGNTYGETGGQQWA